MRHEHVVGDMQVNGDGSVDGWCWAPARPRWRVRYEILVDDRPVGRGTAALPRPDLAMRDMPDTRHGFWLRLPAGALDPATPCLVSAVSRGVVFGRRRLDPPDPLHADPAELAMQAALGAISERLAAWRPPPPAAGGLRATAGMLAAALPGRPGRAGADIAAACRVLAAGAPPPRLARPATARVSLLLPASAEAPATLARLRALAPATATLAAEILLLDPGEDARTVLLPALAPGLLLCAAAWGHAAAAARGDWVMLLADEAPSAAGLEELLIRLQGGIATLAVSARLAAAAGLPPWRMTLPAGVALAVRRGMVQPDDDIATLGRRHAGRSVALLEPWT